MHHPASSGREDERGPSTLIEHPQDRGGGALVIRSEKNRNREVGVTSRTDQTGEHGALTPSSAPRWWCP